MEINTYPSDARPLNVHRRKDGYSMAMMMSCDKDSCSDVIAQEMDLYGAHLVEPAIQALGYNDLYVIKSMFITKRKRGKGYGTYVLSHIEDALRCISNDSNPVIAVVPHAFENPADTDRVIKFFKSNNFKQVHEDSRTLLKY
jgi:GNAT superfamily N-acetyltransferase